jgi:hypothetical protein
MLELIVFLDEFEVKVKVLEAEDATGLVPFMVT